MYDLHGETVHFDTEHNRLLLLDQTKLPNQTVVLSLYRLDDMVEAIYRLRVRGAPAIGVAAAVGLAVLANDSTAKTPDAFQAEFLKNAATLETARPTAVNLSWAVGEMRKTQGAHSAESIAVQKAALTARALELHAADIAVCRKIGEYGAAILKDCDAVLTHCNAGRLATVQYGTALSPVYVSKEQGHNIKVYADETRPLLQGARLTAYELCEAGIDVTVLCDNMASYVMQQGLVQAVLVGCDRVAKNGDTANKIGTSGVAILAKHYGIPFYVCAPFSTIDKNTPTGAEIPIEQRDGEELRALWYETPKIPRNAKTLNPAFDVTDHRLITAFITEKGVLQPSDF
ncbi:MAG: S-methyl-5-thioribose-1-phosphate isomerase [Candidatus Fimenecus sp.]